MGTRHLICVQHNNEYKVANYGQWDGYPDGQGSSILAFLDEKFDRSVFIEKLNNLFVPTEDQIREWYKEAGQTRTDGWLEMDVAQRFKEKYPSLSNDAGSDILGIIQNSESPVPIRKYLEFAAESLFCEWAYVIDLDKNTFEVFQGFNKSPLDSNERFASITSPDSNEGYYQVKFLESFDLDNLPSEEDFVAQLCHEED
ncbi:hypothetical protein [Acinetobacter baumannii]|uniref:hypothetical protein n=1 Tax=Acinetobacter baumannii TaxID=470 RepID=UPI002740D54D|nr:hypothetical protein [Acinetobacter baumannii]MDP7806364.1 hypothetical protein [Acinetobacter baumannii]MDP7859113.1 hypothetical protein [Acinetobacter baumannii]MDP7877838.1 hypothetical protein [Acinetobacter baumannii]